VKWPDRKFDTARPTSLGRKRRASSSTYLRNSSVAMIDAYVDGRPMPYSSSVLTSDASE
jgi:hypothetical protein